MKRVMTLLFVLLISIPLLSGCTSSQNVNPMPFSSEEALLRYPYTQLDNRQQSVYKALYDGISDMKEKIQLPYTVSGDEYEMLFTLLYRQEPQFFYLDGKYMVDDKISSAKVSYKYSVAETENMQSEINQKVQSIMSDVNSYDSQYEKFLYIHDYIADNASYNSQLSYDTNTIYGCIVNNKAQCEGYSKTLVYLSRLAGINAMTIIGHTDDGTNHEWNIIQIDGKYYNTDLTWDDPLTDDKIGERIWHLYFNVKDSEIYNVTHFPEGNDFTLPVCDSIDANYYEMNGTLADTYDEGYAILSNEILKAANNKNNFAEIKFSNKEAYDETVEKLFDNQEIFQILKNANENSINKFDTSLYYKHKKDGVFCISIGLVYK